MRNGLLAEQTNAYAYAHVNKHTTRSARSTEPGQAHANRICFVATWKERNTKKKEAFERQSPGLRVRSPD